MEWTEEMTIIFIERIKDYPCLWDVYHEDKKNKAKIADTYQTLAKELDTDIATLKKRKENIFQTYRNYKRKVARSKLKASGEEAVYQPSWPLYPFLDAFLHPVYTPKGPISSMKEEKRSDIDESQTLDEGDQQAEEDDEFIETDPLEMASGHLTGPTTSKVRRIERPTDSSFTNTVLKQVIEINKRILQKTSTRCDPTTPKDECSLYGELMALRLRKLDDAQRQFAMYEMDNILYNITLGMSLSRSESIYPGPYSNNQLNHHSPVGSASPLTPKITLNVENLADES